MLGNLKTLATHVAFWLLYTSFAVVAYGYGNIAGYIYETTLSFFIGATIFYAHACFLLPRFLDRKKKAAYLLGLIALYGYNIAIRYIAFVWYPRISHSPSSAVDLPLVKNIISFSWQWCTFILLSYGYWFAFRLVRAEKLARQQERLQLENAALRAQINPHFLFNTLDSFRIESKSVLPEMSQSIAALIELMRSAFATPDENGLIPVEKEIRAFEGLINIYRRRFPYIQLQYIKALPDSCGLKIPPHILLTFIENMFKHGDFTDTEKPLRINLEITHTGLELSTYNKKDYRIADDSHGIGMKYITRLLEGSYAGRYKLHIENGVDDYTVQLKIFSQ